MVVARAQTLWEVIREVLPGLTARFDEFRRTIGTASELETLQGVYRDSPPASFSTAVMERVPDRTVILPLRGVTWSDWDKPEQVVETLSAVERESGSSRRPVTV